MNRNANRTEGKPIRRTADDVLQHEIQRAAAKKDLVRLRAYWAVALFAPPCVGLLAAYVSIEEMSMGRFGLMLITSIMLWAVTIPLVLWQTSPKSRIFLTAGIALLFFLGLTVTIYIVGAKAYKDNASKRLRSTNRDALLALAKKHRPYLRAREALYENPVGPMLVVHLPPGSESWELHPCNDRLPIPRQAGNPDDVALIAYVKTNGKSRSRTKVLRSENDPTIGYYFESWNIQLTVYDIQTATTIVYTEGSSSNKGGRSFYRGARSDGMPGSGNGFTEDGEAWVDDYNNDTWAEDALIQMLNHSTNSRGK